MIDMGITRWVVTVLDRPGGRWLLARIATLRTGVRVGFQDRWTRVLKDGLVVVDGLRFPYFSDTLASTESDLASIEAGARDGWLFDYTPSPNHVVVDVGAGSGTELRLFAPHVTQVYAIEAHPETYARLVLTIRRNGWSNVTPIHAAVTDRPGTVHIADGSDDLSNALGDSGIPVPGRTLDAICDEYGVSQVDFLKMNIEGAERLAIRGMDRVVARTERLCIACHDFLAAGSGKDFYRTKATVREYLHRRGLEVVTREDHPRRHTRDNVYARRPITDKSPNSPGPAGQ